MVCADYVYWEPEMDKRLKLVDFIRTNVDEDFSPEDDSLLDIMDSVSFLRLIVFIEEELKIELDMTAVSLDEFESIDSLMNMLDGAEVHA